MSRRRWTAACLAAVFGYGLLALLYPRLSPVSAWGYSLTRDRAIRAAEAVAARLGQDVRGWTPSYAVVPTDDVSATYRRTRPGSPEIESYVPRLHSHVLFTKSLGGQTLSVRFGGDDRPLGFTQSPPAAVTGGAPPNVEVARAALAAFLDTETATQTAGVQPRASSSESGERFTFPVPSAADPTEMEINAEVTVHNGVATSATIGPAFTDQYSNTTQSEDTALRILSIPSIVLGVVIWPAVFTLVMVSLLRRELDWRSSVGFVVLLLALSIVPIAAGSRENARVRALVQPQTTSGVTVSTNQGQTSRQVGQNVGRALQVWSPLLLVFVPFWAAGYPLARRSAPAAVVTARDFLLARLSRSTVGRSIVAGVMFGGLLAAVPYVVAALHVSPHALLDADGVRAYALGYRHPAIAAIMATVDATLLILFAFVVPLIAVYVPRPAIARVSIAAVVGLWLIADTPFDVSVAAAILSGVLLTAAAYLIYTRYDLLTVLIAGAVSRVAVHAFALQVQPSPETSTAAIYVWAGLVIVAAAGLAVATWGRPVDLTASAEEIAIGLSSIGDRVDRERLRAEFDLARRVQQQMLPVIPPAVDGFALAASCRPAREVGGDLYDFIRLDDRRYLMAVADVSGKGVPAALFMTMTKGLVSALAEQVTEPDRIAWSMNEHLYETCARRIFVTLALGVLDTRERTFRYTRAGHNPPIWRRSIRRETHLLRKGGVGLGLVKPRMFNSRTSTEVIDLEPSDALVLYSDGIVEAMNAAREEYGEERLVSTIERGDHLDAAALRDAILADVQAFVGGAAAHDDMTLLVVRAAS